MEIIIVDDDEIAQSISEKVLTHEGYDVILAENGREALEKIRENGTQIVILDWNMPVMDGIELCRILRTNQGLGYTYIIMVTSRNQKEDILEGLTAGANDFITKPFEPAELLLRVRNAEQILALQTTTMTLFSLAKLAESKDSDTGNHLERIRAYAKALGTQLLKDTSLDEKIDHRLPELLYETSPLHDIGKVGIPDSVLLKPSSLNDTEWKIMKSHAEIGAMTLNEVLEKYPKADFLKIARDIAWSHHERWDGTGYPRGLKGIEIPLVGRIVAIADVYDAITMKRVYKAAMPHQLARGIILEGRGNQFDSKIVDAFLAIEDQFIMIHGSYEN